MLAVLLTRFAELSVSLGSVFVSNSSIRISVIVVNRPGFSGD